jgi:pilus assembly protein FimV
VLRSMLRALLVVGLLPATAHALGFGDIRLNSALNAPLNAEIDISASAEELATLSAGLASRDTFSRNGLDYPAFFATATVAIEKAADGRSLLRVRTPDPVTEPFLTMLIEVSHARGRLVREYTVLLDPPVLSTQAVAAPVSAPTVNEPRVNEPRVNEPTVVNDSVATSGSADTASSSYRVRAGDTLNQIASRLLPGSDRNSSLVALYRGNSAAFDGNMNDLRSGASLLVPSAAAVAAIGPAAAASEVGQQYRSWPGAGRLRLVPPAGTVEAVGNSAGPATASSASASNNGPSNNGEVAALQRQVSSLEQQLQESKRLLELRNAELATLQQRQTGNAPALPLPVVVPPTSTETPVVSAPTPAEPTAVVEPTPVAEPISVVKPVTPAAEPDSLLDKLLANWQLLAGGIAVLALAWFGFMRWQRSRAEAESTDDFDRPVTEGFERAQTTTQTLPFRVLPDERSDSILVEESGSHVKLSLPTAAPRIKVVPPSAASKPAASVFEAAGATVTTTAMTIEQGDSLAEADFHMAYGLYDQAAELVKLAIAREPERRDLRVKLLEVFFVWGNKDEFLTQARELATTRSESAPGEWEKIIIMGRQIAGGDPLFTGSDTAAGVAAGGVDLNLEGGHNRVDFNIMGEPTLAGVSSESVDIDFGAEPSANGDSASPGAATSGIDFVFDDPNRGDGDTVALTGAQKTTRLEMPDATVMLSDPEGPTAEMPELPSGEQGTIRQKLDAATSLLSTGGMGEQTAELAIDDLGLDIGTMDVPVVHETTVSDQLALSMVLDAAPDAVTAERTAITDMGTSGEHLADMTAAIAIEPTMTQMFNAAEPTNEVLSLNDDTGTVEGPPNGFSEDHTATMKVPAPLDADDPPTMSEVGTKLDLARAYMDMGDPEGARSILDEVMHEGSASQKQEARRLMDSLPG